MKTIFVRYVGEKKFHPLMTDFHSVHEAMTWLITTYEHNASFWSQVFGVKVE